MKLHLPVMLRRSLLALIALLSPAVVTTTLATATLASFSAAAAGLDNLTLIKDTYVIDSNKSYGIVTTGKNSVTLQAEGALRNFTATEVYVKNGHTLNLTIKVKDIAHLAFYAGELFVEENATINITAGDCSLRTRGDLYQLLNNVRDGGIIIKQGDDLFVGDIFHLEGAGATGLTTSFISPKFGINTNDSVTCLIYITEGQLTIDSNMNETAGLNYQLAIGTDSAATATITSAVNELTTYLNIGDFDNKTNSTLQIEAANSALSINSSIYLNPGSTMVSNRDLIFQNNVYFYNNNTITLNGNTTFVKEVYVTHSNQANACTLTSNGKVTVAKDAIIELNPGTKWNIGGIIENNGSLIFDGSCTMNIVSSRLQGEYAYTAGSNGYRQGTSYTVLTGTGAITGITNCTWLVDSATASYANGKVTVSGRDNSVYYVKNGVVNYGTGVANLETASTKFSLEGGSLELGKKLENSQGIVAKTASSSVKILSGTELKSNQVTVEGSGSVVLSGGGSYTMANGANTLGTGVSVGSDWSGTVNTTGNTSALALDTLGVSDSKVELGSNSHTLAARDQSVAANLTSTGSISLTGNKLTLSGTNSLGSVSVGSLEITGGSTAISNGLTTDSISGTVSVTGGTLQEMTAGSAISTSGSVSLSNVTLGAVLNNSGTLNLGGTINVDSTALTSGTRERYSAGNNGYKITDTTYTVLTGNAATGTATWKVGTDSATYEDGMVIVAGIEDKSVYYVKNGDVNYTQSLAQATTIFSLEGGHLQLGETLLDTQSIVSKNNNSWVCLKDEAGQLKSSQISLDGAEFVTLQAADGGTYIIDKVVDGIVELTLGTGVKLAEDLWWGTVKTVGDTTVSSDLDTTGWKNTELNGTTTVKNGVTLTLGGNTKLKGQIVNNGTLVLGGTTTVDSGVTLTLGGNTKLKGQIVNNGTLNLGGNITIDTNAFDGVVSSTAPHYQQGSSAKSMTSGFMSTKGMEIQVVEGNAANASDAIWKVDSITNGGYTFDSTGKLHVVDKDSVVTLFYINTGDTITYDKNAAMFENINGLHATELVLNGGALTLSTELLNNTMVIRAEQAGFVEIGEGVNLNASQLNVESAPVTLTGKGTYILADGITTLDANVVLGSDWSGTLQTSGNTTNMNLGLLAQGSTSLDLGDEDHTLLAQDQEVTADLTSTGSISLTGNKLTLSGTNSLGSLNVGSLEIAGESTEISNGLTTGGDSSVATGATLDINGDSTLGGKITNGGTLVLDGNITVDTSTFAAEDVLNSNEYYQQGSSSTKTTSGFLSTDGMQIQVVTGTAADDTGASWSVDGVTNGSFTFDEATGKLHVVSKDSVGTEFYINTGDTITYNQSDAKFTNVNNIYATGLVLNGGNLVLAEELLNDTMEIVAKQAGSVEICDSVNLNASQLDASVADVTLSGGGSYTMTNGANTLGTGVSVGDGWSGTVNTTGDTSALELDKLGVSGSTVALGSNSHTLAARDQEVAANITSTGSISLTGNKLTLSGTNTLGSLNVGSLEITGGSTAISNGLTTGSLVSTNGGSISIANGLTTDSISGTVSVTGGTLQEMTAGAAISTSGTVALSDVTLGAVLNNSGTLSFAGNMTLDTSLLGASPENENWYSGSNAAGEPGTTGGSGFRTIQDIYTVVTGATADNTADWQLTDGRDAEYAGGKVLAFQEKDFSTYWVNEGSEVSLDNADDVFTTDTTTLALNGGKLVVDTNTGLTLQSHVASAVEIANGSALNASQLDASAADVTLSGGGSYTMTNGANTLGTGVSVGSDWSGTVNTTGDTSALELDTLGVSGSKVALGSNSHTLAARNQSVAANLNSAGSISLTGYTLTLSGTNNALGSVSVGSLEIAGGSTTVDNGLTTVGESSVATGASLSIKGASSIGGKIENSGTLNLGGTITVNKDTFTPDSVVKEVMGYFIGSSTMPNSTNSGFEAACWDITIAKGGTITDNGATWKLVGDENATFDFEDDGTLHAYGSGVGTVFHVAEGDSITYSKSNAADFVNSKGEAASAIQLNGGTLVLQSELDTTVKSAAASSMVIAEGVNLNASQLDTSAAGVTLSGKGCYTLGADANALNTGVGLGSDWNGTVKLTGAATTLELSSLGNAHSSIDLGSFNHTLADGAHVIDSALMGSGSLMLNEGSKLTLNGDCSNWSGDIIGQVELELTEGGTMGGNVQVDSLSFGENSSSAFEGNLTTKGTITVADNATLSLNGNTTLGGTIESADSGTVNLAGQITVDVENFKSTTEVRNVTGYFIGSSTTPNSTNSGFEAACWDITIAEGGTITDNGATWKLVGDENATFDFAADGTLHAYGSGVGTVFHVAEGDTITYSESNAEDFVNSKGEAVSAIQLNGGTLELGAALDTTVESAAASSMVIVDGVTLNADQLDASAADVTLSGKGCYNMQGQELNGVVELNTGVKLDADEWQGTVYTGIVAQNASLDITALGNSQSTVYLGAQPMRRSMPGETVLESLTADGVGTTETPGSLTLQKGESTADNLVVNGILTLGTADAAAYLEADSVSLQELNFAHADSRLVTGKLEGATTLNVQLTDEVLSNKDAGETLTLVSLKDEFKGTLTFNGDAETERVRSEDNREEYTLSWNEGGTVLTLTILGTETYVTEQVAPTTGNGRAAVELMTDVFLNSRPQKNAPEGALAGILNAVDAGTATDRDMAAVAGASAAVLDQALSGDVERQLSAIRNRSMTGNTANTITLASEKSGKQTGSRFFAWVNAEGNRAEQDADSTAAGYTLTSRGGTLGAGMQVNDKLTLGLALTAMHGDLQSDAPDSLKGDMDTTYVSAFARYNRGRWSHAFIGTVGTMEADYKRTVSHSAGGYNTSGDTDGTAFGLMYEVSRSMKLSNRSTLSPVVNISYRHTEVDSYSESGADAALNVGKQSLDTVTAGAGARYAAVVGQRMLNRACGFEARALVKYDLGDRQSKTGVGINGYATRAGIESAELGAFGVELGAGISVPVGSGSIFADGAVELRSDYTNYNATVGYRIQF